MIADGSKSKRPHQRAYETSSVSRRNLRVTEPERPHSRPIERQQQEQHHEPRRQRRAAARLQLLLRQVYSAQAGIRERSVDDMTSRDEEIVLQKVTAAAQLKSVGFPRQIWDLICHLRYGISHIPNPISHIPYPK